MNTVFVHTLHVCDPNEVTVSYGMCFNKFSRFIMSTP